MYTSKTFTVASMNVQPHTQPLSARELNACLDALTESFNHLNLGYVRRNKIYAVPTGWTPDGYTITSVMSGPVVGFLTMDMDKRLAMRIARYFLPQRVTLTDNDVRRALQAVGQEVIENMQTRLVRTGVMVQMSVPEVHTDEEWLRHFPDDMAVGVVPLYSTCGLCYLAFNLSNSH